MRRRWLTVFLAIVLPALAAAAGSPAGFPAPADEYGRLRIHGATDLAAMAPVLRDFQEAHPGITIDYVEQLTTELFQAVATAPPGAQTPDLVISSAMDLQVKLVNDGFAQPHRSAATAALPDWANWRDEAFGFTFEPAVIVYNRDLLDPEEVPRSHIELTRTLEEQAGRLRGRVATYDVARSGIGYLFAAHDSVLSSAFWRLVSALGRVGARLVCCTAEVLDAVERGDALIGYNVLGSYARARELAGAPIGIVLPRDYTLVMSRVVLVPRRARNPSLAKLFVDYLLSPRGQGVIASQSLLSAIRPGPRDAAAAAIGPEAAEPFQPITVGPALLVFADQLKRRRFIDDWRRAIEPR